MTKRLHEKLAHFETCLQSSDSLSEEDYWTEFFRDFQKNAVIGLMLYSIEHGDADPHLLAHQISRMATEDSSN